MCCACSLVNDSCGQKDGIDITYLNDDVTIPFKAFWVFDQVLPDRECQLCIWIFVLVEALMLVQTSLKLPKINHIVTTKTEYKPFMCKELTRNKQPESYFNESLDEGGGSSTS